MTFLKNESAVKTIEVVQEMVLENMKIRGERPTKHRLDYTVAPGESKLVIIDEVERGSDSKCEIKIEVSYDEVVNP